jgi:hypothetical protein
LGSWLTLCLVTKPFFCLPLAKMTLTSTVAGIIDGTAPEPMLIPAIEPTPAGVLRSPTHTKRSLTHALVKKFRLSSIVLLGQKRGWTPS